jgi:hypothetical protein
MANTGDVWARHLARQVEALGKAMVEGVAPLVAALHAGSVEVNRGLAHVGEALEVWEDTPIMAKVLRELAETSGDLPDGPRIWAPGDPGWGPPDAARHRPDDPEW